MGFSRQEYRSGLPFPPPVGRALSELCAVTGPSWVAPQVKVPSLQQCWDPPTQVHVMCLGTCDNIQFSLEICVFYIRTNYPHTLT